MAWLLVVLLALAMQAGFVQAAETGAADACALAPEPGPCKAMFEKYYYDAPSRTCRTFFWGGCQGVVPFESMEECQAACENPAEMRVKYRTMDTADPALILDVDYPKDWDEPEFKILVNGAEPAVRRTGGGSDTQKQMASFRLAPGQAGKKEILVTATAGDNTGQASASFYWSADPVLKLLDLGGQSTALFQAEPVRILAYMLKDVSATLNGAPMELKTDRQDQALGDILSATPDWKPGLNTIAVQAQNMQGAAVTGEYTFVYMPDGRIPLSRTAVLTYGEMGSKSGPFYRVEADGEALLLEDEQFATVAAVDDQGWLLPRTMLTVALAPLKPGPGVLNIYKKEHFTMAEQLEQTIPFTVVEE
jgi:hypothetical protein